MKQIINMIHVDDSNLVDFRVSDEMAIADRGQFDRFPFQS